MSEPTIIAGLPRDVPESGFAATPLTHATPGTAAPDDGVEDPRQAGPTTVLESRAAKAPAIPVSVPSAYQARLSYDQEKASVFVEIVEAATGDVIRRFPAESAADEMREFTGDSAGAIVDSSA